MDKQLRLSAERATAEEQLRQQRAETAGAAPAEAATAQPALPLSKQSQREARLAERAALEKELAALREQSALVQQELTARLRDLEAHALSAATRMQLQQSGTFDEGDFSTPAEPPAGPEGDPASQAASGRSPPHGGALAPGAKVSVHEDGALLFASDASYGLESAAVEDVLTA